MYRNKFLESRNLETLEYLFLNKTHQNYKFFILQISIIDIFLQYFFN